MKIPEGIVTFEGNGESIPINIKVVPITPGLVDHIVTHWEQGDKYHTFEYHLKRSFDEEGRVLPTVKSTLSFDVPVMSVELWRVPLIKFETLMEIIHCIRPFTSPVNLSHSIYDIEHVRVFFRDGIYEDRLRLTSVRCSSLHFSAKDANRPLEGMIEEFIDFGRREFGAYSNARLTKQARRKYKETNSISLGYVAQEES